MKTLRLSTLIILMIISLKSTAQYDTLFSVVSGDTVTLWEATAWRNCAAVYIMEIEQDGYSLIWKQIDTTGDGANCNCFFDLSVSFIVTIPGTYHADVYYTPGLEPGNFIYEGSIDFTIGGKFSRVRSEILGQYQSECYHNLGINEGTDSDLAFNLYPNPLKDGDVLNLEAISNGRKAILEIFTLTGKQVFSREYNGNQKIQDYFIKEELFPVPGIYIIRLRTSDNVFTRKITVL